MNKNTKKIIAREFLWALSSVILLLCCFFILDNIRHKNLRQIEKFESEIEKIKKFEPYKSLTDLVNYASSSDEIDSYVKNNKVLSKFEKQSLLDYIATINSGKYKNDRIVNSKFPEFGFDKNGLHKNFTKKDLKAYRNYKKEIEKIKSSMYNDDILLITFILLFFTFGIRYVFYATKWSLKQLREE